MKIAKRGLAVGLLVVLVVSGATAAHGASATFAGGGVPKSQQFPNFTTFKLKGGGQIDFDNGVLSMGGNASHLGNFTTVGDLNVSTLTFTGVLDGGDGHDFSATMTLVAVSPGTYTATLTAIGLPGNTFLDGIIASGVLVLDQDLMFTIDLTGTYNHCIQDATHSCE